MGWKTIESKFLKTILSKLLRNNCYLIIITYLVVAWYGIFNSVCARKVSRKM